jgi:NitT/TauT family transport system substrate-binding protein
MRSARRGVATLLAAYLVVACSPAPAPARAPAAPPPAAAAPTSGDPPAAASVVAPASAASPGQPAGSAGGTISATPLDPPQKVRVDSQGLGAEVPVFLAIEQGYFRELGLEVELVPMAGSAENLALLNSGQLDVGVLPVTPGLFNAVSRGVAVRAVADRGSSMPGRTTSNLSIRADLLERKPWSGYQDLRGMRIAIVQFGSMNEYNLEAMLRRGGVQREEVEVIPLTFPDMALAFANRSIDAGMNNEPWATQQEQLGLIKKVAYADDAAPGMHVALVVYGESFAQNTAAARNYMIAWLRGVRDYWDAYDGRGDFQRVVDALHKYTPLKDEALIRKVPPTGMNPAGYLDPERLAALQDWFVERGLVTQRAEVEKVYDRAFADYANAVLGPYQPVESPRRPN